MVISTLFYLIFTVVTGAVATIAASTVLAWVPIAAGIGAAVLVGSAVNNAANKLSRFFLKTK
jgi:ABC-type tungstate transport system substrate-binding protein